MAAKLDVSCTDFKQTLENIDIVLSDYAIQEQLLKEQFDKYPQNTELDQVLLKVDLLNTFYSTGIQDTLAVARNIVDNVKDADELMSKGDPTIVHRIALVNHGKNGKPKVVNHFSFATKYCSFHQPFLYPIYDELVYKVLSKLRVSLTTKAFNQETLKDKGWTTEKGPDCGYSFYKCIYDRFIELYASRFENRDYKTIDHYLWGSRKINKLDENDYRITGNNKCKKASYESVINNALNIFMNNK